MTRIFRLIALIVAGEMIFALPFHTQRYFRPTLLEAFEITNTQLGDMFAAFGLTAMFSYLFGGPFADRYPARNLMAISLILTAAGGFYMSGYPGVMEMTALYAFWGVTTAFLFWAALIKATRDWGGDSSQGVAFGVLDGGRGMAAAIFAGAAISVLAYYIPDESLVSDAERREGFRTVIIYYSMLTLACAVLVWLLIPHNEADVQKRGNIFANLPQVLRRPIIWAHAGIIVCAYCGYKGLDNYALYAVQVLGMNEVDGARLATYGAWLRPVACVVAGLLADRFDGGRSIVVSFVFMIGTFGMLSYATPHNAGTAVIFATVFVSFFAVYAIRGIYFALLEETRTPKHLTGASVAVVSFVGFTPEAFFGPITGRILDANPGVQGHLDYFLFLTVVSILGVAVSALLIRLNRNETSA